jgi:hypothetical protein
MIEGRSQFFAAAADIGRSPPGDQHLSIGQNGFCRLINEHPIYANQTCKNESSGIFTTCHQSSAHKRTIESLGLWTYFLDHINDMEEALRKGAVVRPTS